MTDNASRKTRPMTGEEYIESLRFFTAPHTVDDLVAYQAAIAEWARMTNGWMGRSPDYKASFLGTLGANAEFYEPFDANARYWYARSQEQVLFWNHAIVHPPVDRNRPPGEVEDVFVHVERETDACLATTRGQKGTSHTRSVDNEHDKR